MLCSIVRSSQYLIRLTSGNTALQVLSVVFMASNLLSGIFCMKACYKNKAAPGAEGGPSLRVRVDRYAQTGTWDASDTAGCRWTRAKGSTCVASAPAAAHLGPAVQLRSVDGGGPFHAGELPSSGSAGGGPKLGWKKLGGWADASPCMISLKFKVEKFCK